MPQPPADTAIRVRQLRARLGLSQQQLATSLQISKLTVLRWEHGRSRPSSRLWQHLQALSAAQPAGEPRNNLPVPANELIGRGEALTELQGTLATSRLVTLTGTGGSGKTRLAIGLAWAARDQFPDGVWFVDLAALSAPELVPRAVASILGVRDRPGDELLSTLSAAVGDTRTLLVLDNCEQLSEACARFADELLAACARVRVLATSREPLGSDRETVWQVLPLVLPGLNEPTTVENVRQASAAQLFVQRASARDRRFILTEQRARAVATICRRLDGLPLALELAAAWASILSVDEIAARLDDRFRFLVRGARLAPARQQTLRAAIDWSYALLSAGERRAFARISVFAGNFDLTAAEAVAAGDGVEHEDLLSLLGGLVDKSLVTADVRQSGARYSLLESLRAYGRDRLTESDEVGATMSRFAVYCVATAQAFRQRMRQGQRQEDIRGVGADHENYRAALQWLADQHQWSEYLSIAGGVWGYWDVTGAIGEARYWLERGLRTAPTSSVAPAVRARALGCLGQSLWRHGSLKEAEDLQRTALAIYLDTEDDDGIAWVQTNLGGLAYGRSDFAAAGEHWQNALETFRALGEPRQVGILLNNLGLVADREGDPDRATSLIAESAVIRREIGDQAGLTSSLINLASLAARRGDERAARTLGEEALDLARSLGQRMQTGAALEELARADFRSQDYAGAEARTREALDIFEAIGYRADEATSRAMLGSIARARGRVAESAALHAAGLGIRREIGDAVEIGQSLVGVALLAFETGEAQFAARLLGAVSNILGAGTLPPGPEDYAAALQQAARAMPAAAFRDAHARGATEQLDAVIEEVLAWTQETAANASPRRSLQGGPRPAGVGLSLTPRELMVMELLTAGSINKEIAAALHLSIRTVERHIANAYAKLGARGRVEAIRLLMELSPAAARGSGR
jgi:predicted ATPase/DNA-binding CsgD family transcriptional regulator/DNA-binding XRE family transcriptional regulator